MSLARQRTTDVPSTSSWWIESFVSDRRRLGLLHYDLVRSGSRSKPTDIAAEGMELAVLRCSDLAPVNR